MRTTSTASTTCGRSRCGGARRSRWTDRRAPRPDRAAAATAPAAPLDPRGGRGGAADRRAAHLAHAPDARRAARRARGPAAGGDRTGVRRAGHRRGRGLDSTRRRTQRMTNALEATLDRFRSATVRRSAAMDDLARRAVFGATEQREQARWLIWEIGQEAGVRPASIHELYLARGRGELPAFTTPAISVRVLAYDTARAVFRAARRLDAGPVSCEIARSDIGYTDQRPGEDVAVVTAAALREGFDGPLFVQGDHVQVNAKKYAADPEAELTALRALIEEELHAGFYNIDVDTSTLGDLSKATLDEQQRVNYA